MQVLSHGDPALELRRVQALVGRNVDGLDAHSDLRCRRRRSICVVERGNPGGDRRPGHARPAIRLRRDRRSQSDARRDHARHRPGPRRSCISCATCGCPSSSGASKDSSEAADAARPSVAGDCHPARSRTMRCSRGRSPKALCRPAPPDGAHREQQRDRAIARTHPAAMKVRWPDDVSLLAFDEPVWAPIVSPPLAVVRHPTQRIADEAWNRLMTRLRSPAEQPKRIMLEAHLVPRRSLGAPPGRTTQPMKRPVAFRSRRAAEGLTRRQVPSVRSPPRALARWPSSTASVPALIRNYTSIASSSTACSTPPPRTRPSSVPRPGSRPTPSPKSRRRCAGAC